MKDRHKGETCIAIANGPSLADVPNEFLESYVTFGVNKIWLKDFAPTYYAATDPIMGQYLYWMMEMRCKEYFLLPGIAKHQPGTNPVNFTRKDEGVVFSYDPLKWISNGNGTVMFTVLHMAYLMGFSTVLMVGLDHSGNVHFHPKYGLWNMTGWIYHWDPERVDHGFQVCRDAYEADDRRIINLTPGSLSEAFEKQDISLWQTHT